MAEQTKRGVYLTELVLENVKPFKGCHNLDLTDENGAPTPWTLILGDNGVGKTTLLQCVAFMAPRLNIVEQTLTISESQTRIEEALVVEARAAEDVATTERYATRREDVHVEMRGNFVANCILGQSLSGEEKFATWIRFSRKEGKTADFEASSVRAPIQEEPLVLGYGAGRHMQTGRFEQVDMPDATESVFEGSSVLLDVEELLQHLDYGALKSADKTKSKLSKSQRKYDIVLKMVAALLPDVAEPSRISVYGPKTAGQEKDGVWFTTPYGEVSFSDLSFGYQTMAAWLCDIAWRLFQKYPDSDNPLREPAIVLVDEIDLHLHPVWQRQLRQSLIEYFPAVQFVATAHSPLMAQASIDANLAVVRRNEDTAEIANDPYVVETWRLDQVITSELFGLPTEWSPYVERLFEEQRSLVAQDQRTEAQDERLKTIRNEVLHLQTGSDDNEAAMDIIRRAAEKLKDTQKPK